MLDFANQYPEIIKILAVGNEAMVHWATSYFVEPKVILKWVKHLQELKKNGKLDKDLWVTSSDNFASWGGGDKAYHKKGTLNELIMTVDLAHISFSKTQSKTGIPVNESSSNDERMIKIY